MKGVPHLRSNEDSSPKKSSESSESPSHRHPPVPPPYRDPPPPTSSINYDKFKKPQESHKVKDSQYKELISLVNYQREKLSTQEVDLNKVRFFLYKIINLFRHKFDINIFLFQFDAEIIYWEEKDREKQFHLEFIAQEIQTFSNTSKITNEQVCNFIIFLFKLKHNVCFRYKR